MILKCLPHYHKPPGPAASPSSIDFCWQSPLWPDFPFHSRPNAQQLTRQQGQGLRDTPENMVCWTSQRKDFIFASFQLFLLFFSFTKLGEDPLAILVWNKWCWNFRSSRERRTESFPSEASSRDEQVTPWELTNVLGSGRGSELNLKGLKLSRIPAPKPRKTKELFLVICSINFYAKNNNKLKQGRGGLAIFETLHRDYLPFTHSGGQPTA